MEAEQQKGLSNARYLHAEECLTEAKALLSNEHYKGAANRSYYAIFHAMRSALVFYDIDMKKHSGIISEFRKEFIKEKIFDETMSDIISKSFSYRQDSDYDDFFVISKEEVQEQVANAEIFLKEIKAYLDKK